MNINEITLISLVLIFLTCLFFMGKKEKKTTTNKSIMSFRESINLTEIPIVTFWNKGKKFNFILDTGSNYSLIDERLLLTFNHTLIDSNGSNATSIDGVTSSVGSCTACLKYNGLTFEELFRVKDMSGAFDSIKKTDGVTIHGILGSNFFTRNQYVLDFDQMIAYIKKH